MAPKSTEKAASLTATTKKEDPKPKDKPEEEPELSEEDRELKERLETCVSTLLSTDGDVTTPLRLKALDIVVTELRSATSSMTSVPKPLKFLRPKLDVLKSYYGTLGEEEGEGLFLKARLGDVLAVLAMTVGNRGEFPFACWLLD